MFVRIDRRRKNPVSTLLLALGLNQEEICETYFQKVDYRLNEDNKWSTPFYPSRYRGVKPLFDLVDTLKDCLYAYSQMVPSIKCNREVMEIAAIKGFSTATDLADYLVKKGTPFRDAHETVGKVVSYAIDEQLSLPDIPLEKLAQFSSSIKADVFKVLSLEGSVEARNHVGGTSPTQVMKAIESAKIDLKTRESESP